MIVWNKFMQTFAWVLYGIVLLFEEVLPHTKHVVNSFGGRFVVHVICISLYIDHIYVIVCIRY